MSHFSTDPCRSMNFKASPASSIPAKQYTVGCSSGPNFSASLPNVLQGTEGDEGPQQGGTREADDVEHRIAACQFLASGHDDGDDDADAHGWGGFQVRLPGKPACVRSAGGPGKHAVPQKPGECGQEQRQRRERDDDLRLGQREAV